MIIVSAIIALNAMGMTYAYWDDQLEIRTTLQVGNIGSGFCDDNYWINIVRDGSEKGNVPSWDDKHKGINESAISDLDITFDEKRQTMYINGTLEDGYKAFVHYSVVNDGTVPIKYMKNEESSDQNKLKMADGLRVQVQQQSKVLEPQEKLFTDNSNGNPKIDIQVPNQPKSKGQHQNSEQLQETGETQVELGTYSFAIDLPFKQWTGEKSSWGYGDED